MKIKFELLSRNSMIIPSDYQNKLCAAFYNAISKVSGYENYHDQPNLHSISQIFGTKQLKNGDYIINPNGNGMLYWIISSPVDELIINAAKHLFETKIITKNLIINNFEILPLTITGEKMKFITQTPIILKQNINNEIHYYVVDDGNEVKTEKHDNKNQSKFWYIHRDNDKCSELMVKSVKNAADIIGFELDPNLNIYFDKSYKRKKVLPVIIKKDKKTGRPIRNTASVCPIIVESNAQTIEFVYNLGIGSSRGVGFGTLY